MTPTAAMAATPHTRRDVDRGSCGLGVLCARDGLHDVGRLSRHGQPDEDDAGEDDEREQVEHTLCGERREPGRVRDAASGFHHVSADAVTESRGEHEVPGLADEYRPREEPDLLGKPSSSRMFLYRAPRIGHENT